MHLKLRNGDELNDTWNIILNNKKDRTVIFEITM